MIKGFLYMCLFKKQHIEKQRILQGVGNCLNRGCAGLYGLIGLIYRIILIINPGKSFKSCASAVQTRGVITKSL